MFHGERKSLYVICGDIGGVGAPASTDSLRWTAKFPQTGLGFNSARQTHCQRFLRPSGGGSPPLIPPVSLPRQNYHRPDKRVHPPPSESVQTSTPRPHSVRFGSLDSLVRCHSSSGSRDMGPEIFTYIIPCPDRQVGPWGYPEPKCAHNTRGSGGDLGNAP